MFLEYDELAD